MRGALLALIVAPFLSPTDYTECVRINNGPLIKQTMPFARKPDLAAMTAYPKTMIFDGMPPPRFRSPLTMTLETGSVAKCGTSEIGAFEACVRDTTVHMPNPCDFPDERFARLLCHETGHLNGWPADHGE